MIYIQEIAVKYSVDLDFDLRNAEVISPESVFKLLRNKIGNETQEVLIGIFLSPANKIVYLKELSRGSQNMLVVTPFEIIQTALFTNCKNVILCHNHPSGDVTPSKEDIKFTTQVQTAFEYVQLRLLDHLIIGHEDFISLQREQKLKLTTNVSQ